MSSDGSEEGFYPSGSDNESDAELTWEDQLENKYLETKDEVGEEIECQNPNREKLVELIDDLKEVLDMEVKAKADNFDLEKPWGYKTLKQMIKVHLKLTQVGTEAEKTEAVASVVASFQQLMAIVSSKEGRVTKSKAEKMVAFMDQFAPSSPWSLPLSTVMDLFDHSFIALKERHQNYNEDHLLWFKMKVRFFERLLQKKIRDPIPEIIKQAQEFCKPGGVLETKRRSQLVQLNALHMQFLCQDLQSGQGSELKSLFSECQSLLEGSIVPPRTLGVIHQTGGKMHMHESSWEMAFQSFLDAFKNFNQAGDGDRIHCLKYMIMAKMLQSGHDSEKIEKEVIALEAQGGQHSEIAQKREGLAKLKKIDIFNAQDTSAFQSHPSVKAMSDLVSAYLVSDIDRFNTVYAENRTELCDDPFIDTYMGPLLVSMQTQAVFRIVKPYTAIKLSSIAQELAISDTEAEALVIALILDGKMTAKIDQCTNILHLDKADDTGKKFDSFTHMARALNACISDVSTSKW